MKRLAPSGRLNGIQAEGIFPILELLGSSLHCCKNLIGDNAAPPDSVLDCITTKTNKQKSLKCADHEILRLGV